MRFPVKHDISKLFIMSPANVLLLLVLATAVTASTINSPVALAITVYNDQFAIVKDTRSITFDQGRSDLFFTDVSSNIQTETVSFKAINNPEDIKVFEQNYEANLINSNSILQRYLEKQVTVYAKLGERSVKIQGKLLGFNSGYILETAYGIQIFKNVEGMEFASLPTGFFTKPTLNWKVFSKSAVTTDCEVAYRTTGFKWKSDYTVVLDESETHGDVGGWVTIDNYSGKKYNNTKLKLIAGDVNTVNDNIRPQAFAMSASPRSVSSAPPTFSEKSFSDFHMYTLSETVTLNDNSQKQVEFIPKVYNINVRKYNLISVSSGGYSMLNLKASNRIEISNTEANKMGMPLPKGIVRVFKTDQADGSLEFIGEDSIDHTPKDETFTLNTGNAFDISADLVATNRRSSGENGAYTADLNLTIWNHKSIETEIVVELNNWRGDNVRFTWGNGYKATKISATKYTISRRFAANEKFSITGSEDYRPL